MRRKLGYALVTVIFAALSTPALSRNLRRVTGMVADEKGMPVPGVTLLVQGCEETFKTDRHGKFDIDIPFTSKSVSAVADGYPTASAPVVGSFVLVKLEPSPTGLSEFDMVQIQVAADTAMAASQAISL